MAIETEEYAIKQWMFLRNQALRSGENATDAPSGYRGIVSQINWNYAELIQVVGQARDFNGVSDPIHVTTSTTYQQGGTGVCELGQDFATLRIVADFDGGTGGTGGQFRLVTAFGTGEFAGNNARAVETVDVTLSDTSGADCTWRVDIKADTGTANLYGFTIFELAMVDGDFPA
jgi:hypothetical protein